MKYITRNVLDTFLVSLMVDLKRNQQIISHTVVWSMRAGDHAIQVIHQVVTLHVMISCDLDHYMSQKCTPERQNKIDYD